MISQANAILKKGFNELVAAKDDKRQEFNEAMNNAYELIDMVFKDLKGCKPAWRLSFDTPDSETIAKRQWVLGLIENNINTKELVMRGLSMARQDKSQYWPSLGVFIEWCKFMNVFSTLPTAIEAYHEAALSAHKPRQDAFTHVVIYLAGKAVGWRYLLESTEKDAYPVFKRAYDVLTRKLAQGEVLTVEKGIDDKSGEPEKPKPFTPNLDLAASNLAAIRDILN